VGMILTAVFATTGGLITGSTDLFVKHLIGLVIVCSFTFIGSFLLLKLTNLIIPLRVKEEDEEIGLDLSQHNETIYDGDMFPKKAFSEAV
jgi:Amt family ammonium transporter